MRLLSVFLLVIATFLIMCDTTDSSSSPSLEIKLIADGPVFYTDGNYSKGKEANLKTHFAIWIEDINGNYIKTLKLNSGTGKAKITTDTVTNISDTTNKLTTLSTWDSKSKASTTFSGQLNSDKIFIELDGLTAASLACHENAEATETATWDFTDKDGNAVAEGTYKFVAEVAALSKLINQDSTTAADTVYQESAYPSQTTYGTVIFKTGTVTPATATTNIKALSATYVE